jgi:hypothetical protein
VSSPLYDIVMAFHVLAAIVGFGALGSTGAYARAVRCDPDPTANASLARYFSSGSNLAGRAILLVPLLGGTLLALGHGRDVGEPWPWIGLGIWTAATVVASTVIWPAERRIQDHFAAASAKAQAGASLGRPARSESGAKSSRVAGAALVVAAGRAETAAAVTSLLFVAAIVVMIWQPR